MKSLGFIKLERLVRAGGLLKRRTPAKAPPTSAAPAEQARMAVICERGSETPTGLDALSRD